MPAWRGGDTVYIIVVRIIATGWAANIFCTVGLRGWSGDLIGDRLPIAVGMFASANTTGYKQDTIILGV